MVESLVDVGLVTPVFGWMTVGKRNNNGDNFGMASKQKQQTILKMMLWNMYLQLHTWPHFGVSIGEKIKCVDWLCSFFQEIKHGMT